MKDKKIEKVFESKAFKELLKLYIGDNVGEGCNCWNCKLTRKTFKKKLKDLLNQPNKVRGK